MFPLASPIRPYPWGSRSVIGRLQGRPTPTDEPEAELWIGAHPSAPSLLPDGSSLADFIEAAPVRTLGESVVARFGVRLPYLLKVLAAELPLSLQAHPDMAQAVSGFAAGNVNYVDGNHKPELLVAMTPMEALCGFRNERVSADRLAALGLPELAPVVAALGRGELRTVVATLLSWPTESRQDLISAVVAAAGTLPPADAMVVELLAAHYPRDMGVLVALLLNHVTLQPGEAVWMPAGNLHAYLRGAGIELMAASDNVLRGGLTPKRVDVPELLKVVRFESFQAPLVSAVRPLPGMITWPVPVPDFALRHVAVAGESYALALFGPRAMICVSGSVTVADDTGEVRLSGGQSAFSAAADGDLRISGSGELYLATVGSA